ncbi:MAG: hypothetical protein KGI54_17985 [Pseudomonadota bacterium]|nr:hypothetical protein [Pseudomonadota bacterium]
MNIYLDIETIPAQDPTVLQSIREELSHDFKAPSGLTKEKAAEELGIDAEKAKYISKDSMLARWVERFRDEKLEEVAEEKWRRTSFDGALGHIAVIGYAIDNDDPGSVWNLIPEADEAEVLSEFFAIIRDSYSPSSDRLPVIVGHNVIDFDLRFIFQRAVILGIEPPAVIPFYARPWDDRVFDTMTRWAGIGNRVSLDKLCKVLGISQKGAELNGEDIDGSMVWDFIKAGRIEDVATYCAGDVMRTREIYKRLTFKR